MNKSIKISSLLLVVLTLISSMCIGASAASTKTKVMATGTAYYAGKTSVMYHQTYCEKSITVKKNKTKTAKAVIETSTTKACSGLNKYVRFSVWVYDVSTGKRVINTVVKANESFSLPKNTKVNKTYSVQIRPYIHSTAWKYYSLYTINAYLKVAQYKLSY